MSVLRPIKDVRLAVAFLTRLPVGTVVDDRPLARAAWAFPLAGLGPGLLGAGVLWAGAQLALHPLACALLGLSAAIWASGALHEDGLADVADGFGGGLDRAKKLAIMHDSRIGAYGVLALIFSVGLRAGLLLGMAGPGTAALGLLTASVASRAVMPGVMAFLPKARADGLGASAGRPGFGAVVIAAGLGIAALAAFGFHFDIALQAAAGGVGALIGAVGVALLAYRQIGGQTGDVIGTAQQTAEVLILVGLAGDGWLR